MIIWLASYPRSGNTLLRTILKRCFDRVSYADEAIHVDSPIRSDSSLVGHRELPVPWPEFYAEATALPETWFVKTHLPPRDGQPYIYVVRDGRSAVRSYRKYYDQYVPEHRPSLYQLIAGDDAYGGWSDHYNAWVDRDGVRGMSVHFEDLHDIAEADLRALAEFIGHDGPITPWSNPFEDLARVEPGFFREGAAAFAADDDWTPLAEHFFRYLHGDLLERLGFAEPGAEPPPEWREFFEWMSSLAQRNRFLAQACDDRLALINRLSEEAQARLDIINRLTPREQA